MCVSRAFARESMSSHWRKWRNWTKQLCSICKVIFRSIRGSVLHFCRQGAKVVVADVNEEDGLETVGMIETIAGKGSAKFIKCDVSKVIYNTDRTILSPILLCQERDVKAMIELTDKSFGKLDVMFNNAGIMHISDDSAECTEEYVWDLTHAINVKVCILGLATSTHCDYKGVFFGCKYGIPLMRRSGGGSVINTASFVACIGAATSQVDISVDFTPAAI
jgi:NAD(P)-dependent dehydrogenase (short-subunit alcohol dehydrogenase family)